MILAFRRKAWDQYQEWQKTDKQVFRKINQLIKATLRDPYGGPGKPEPLRLEFSGYWSRRITEEHRLVYKVENETLYIAQCRYHYET